VLLVVVVVVHSIHVSQGPLVMAIGMSGFSIVTIVYAAYAYAAGR